MMDHDKLVLISILPGIDAAIEQLTRQRDDILGALGLGSRPQAVALNLTLRPEDAVPPTRKPKRALPKPAPVCPECHAVFQRPQGLASHMRQSHRVTIQGKPVKAAKHPCEFCSHTPFKSRSGWVSHMRGNHPEQLAKAATA
jgi:hypothetical protein